MPISIQRLIARLTYGRHMQKLEQVIGYRLAFPKIPELYVDGLMSCDMTPTWTKYGLNIVHGGNYFLMGKVEEGVSSRFLANNLAYQSWLGGYTVKLKEGRPWSVQDHLNLAIADQKSWLRRYGDSNPLCDMHEGDFQLVGSLTLGEYAGTWYEGGCSTHSDVGQGYSSFRPWWSAIGIATMMNTSNPFLKLRGRMMRPKSKGSSYETLELKGYIATFDIEKDVKVVLYGNGIVGNSSGTTETFEKIKNDLRSAMESCCIVKV